MVGQVTGGRNLQGDVHVHGEDEEGEGEARLLHLSYEHRVPG